MTVRERVMGYAPRGLFSQEGKDIKELERLDNDIMAAADQFRATVAKFGDTSFEAQEARDNYRSFFVRRDIVQERLDTIRTVQHEKGYTKSVFYEKFNNGWVIDKHAAAKNNYDTEFASGEVSAETANKYSLMSEELERRKGFRATSLQMGIGQDPKLGNKAGYHGVHSHVTVGFESLYEKVEWHTNYKGLVKAALYNHGPMDFDWDRTDAAEQTNLLHQARDIVKPGTDTTDFTEKLIRQLNKSERGYNPPPILSITTPNNTGHGPAREYTGV